VWPDEKVKKMRSIFSDPAYLEGCNFTYLHKVVLGILVVDMSSSVLKLLGPEVDRQDRTGKTALYWAAARGDVDKVRVLLAGGADASIRANNSRTPMHAIAARPDAQDDNEIVRLLHEYGGKDLIDVTDTIGETALQIASSVGARGAVRELLQLGADLEIADIHVRTPLLAACCRTRADIVQLLLEAGANPHAAERNGCTSFHHAVTRNRHVELRLLLGKAPDAAGCTAAGSNRETILHLAAKCADIDTLEILTAARLQGLLDPALRTHGGLTAEQMAETHRPRDENGPWWQAFQKLLDDLNGAEDEDAGSDMSGSQMDEYFHDALEHLDRLNASDDVHRL
jgi:ankyrin repeat protein